MPDVERVQEPSDDSDTDDEVRRIPLPAGPPPGRHSKAADEKEQEKERLPEIAVESKQTYEAKPVMRDLFREAAVMVPSVVQRRKPATVQTPVPEPITSANEGSRQPMLEDYASDEEEAYGVGGDMAPEEEAYLRSQGLKRKLTSDHE